FWCTVHVHPAALSDIWAIRCSSRPIKPTDMIDGTIAPARRSPSRKLIQMDLPKLGAASKVSNPSRTAALNRLPVTFCSGDGVEPSKYSSGMVRSGGICTVVAVTIKVMTKEAQQNVVHMCIKSKDLATITINAAATVENPVATIAASRPV